MPMMFNRKQIDGLLREFYCMLDRYRRICNCWKYKQPPDFSDLIRSYIISLLKTRSLSALIQHCKSVHRRIISSIISHCMSNNPYLSMDMKMLEQIGRYRPLQVERVLARFGADRGVLIGCGRPNNYGRPIAEVLPSSCHDRRWVM